MAQAARARQSSAAAHVSLPCSPAQPDPGKTRGLLPDPPSPAHLLNPALPAMMMPTITPNSPSALPKISTTRIFTNSVEF
jgi:hypothetical protein